MCSVVDEASVQGIEAGVVVVSTAVAAAAAVVDLSLMHAVAETAMVVEVVVEGRVMVHLNYSE